MAFVVEDGTGKSDANSYASVAQADAYFFDRMITGWSGTTTEKQAYLIKATDYIDTRFGRKFISSKSSETQSLEFPRVDISGIPAKLIMATCEYALRAKTSPLAPDPVQDATGGKVAAKKTIVGPITTSITYAEKISISHFKMYPYADELLATLVLSGKTVYR